MTSDPIAAFQKKHVRWIMILVGIFLLAIALLTGGIVLINRKAEEVKASRTERVQIMKDIEAIAQLSDGKKAADTLLPGLQESLPRAIDIPVIVIPRVKALAMARGVKIDFTLTGGQPTALQGFSGINFSIRAQGTTANLIAFMTDLETAKNVMSIADWNMSASAGGPSTLSIIGLVYARNEQ